MQNKKEFISFVIFVLALLGFADSVYLTYEHFAGVLPPCGTNPLIDCGQVLTSKYSVFFGIPLALVGAIHYLAESFCAFKSAFSRSNTYRLTLIGLSCVGFLVSLYLLYIMIFVIGAICLYCLISALISILLFFLINLRYESARKHATAIMFEALYVYLLKPVLFLIDPETVHVFFLELGGLMGKSRLVKKFLRFLFVDGSFKKTNLAGIRFPSPIGLAAGFDYEAKLTQILPSLGFGFMSVGTVTNMPYEGNKKPRLGRLPKSKSLMVNKGFKSPGADEIIKRLEGKKFEIPVGISIGRTNSDKLNQKESIEDIVEAFKKFEKSGVKHSYYELNISCPNLKGDVSFYPDIRKLAQLLAAVDGIKIKKPVFIKMPIDITNKQAEKMLEAIATSKVKGLIFGNLQKDRKDKSLIKEEVGKFSVGNFSGKPTFARSNELLEFVSKKYANRFVVIGCGGVFDAKDAQAKFQSGAQLVQLITGMIFKGPQLVSRINFEMK